MAIKRFNDYETTQAYQDYQQLPKGGYVLKILNAEVCENSIGQYIKISCDIAEGEYAGFFAAEYKNQQSEDKKWHCNYLLNVPNDDGTEKDGWPFSSNSPLSNRSFKSRNNISFISRPDVSSLQKITFALYLTIQAEADAK